MNRTFIITLTAVTVVIVGTTIMSRHFGATKESQWQEAVLTCDVETIDRLLQSGVDPGQLIDVSGKEMPAFVVFALDGCERGMQVLLDRGADVDVVDEDSRTALSHAAERADTALAQYLLSHGAYVDPVDRFGWSPLLWATHKQNADVAQILLENGAAVNFQGTNCGNTSLMFACGQGNLMLVRLLLGHGADPEINRGTGQTALWHAMENAAHTGRDESFDVIDELLRQELSYETRALALALSAGASGPASGISLQRVIDSGVDVKAARFGGKSALHWAAEYGTCEAVRILLEAGADPLAQTLAGESALDLAKARTDADGSEIVSVLEQIIE